MVNYLGPLRLSFVVHLLYTYHIFGVFVVVVVCWETAMKLSNLAAVEGNA